MRFLNKITSEYLIIEIPEGADSAPYLVKHYYNPTDWLIVPDDGDFIPSDKDARGFVEKPVDLAIYKAGKLLEAENKFNMAMKTPFLCGAYFLCAEWGDIYTQTYIAMKDDIEDGELNIEYKILLITSLEPLTLENIVMNFDQFKPLYKAVKEQFKLLQIKKHDFQVQIQNALTAAELETIDIDYSEA